MSFCAGAIKKLVSALGVDEAKYYYNLAKKQQTLEDSWKRRIERYINELNEKVLDALMNTGTIPTVDFSKIFTEQAIDVSLEAFKSANKPPKNSKLAKPTVKGVPRSLKDLMKVWDEFRKNGKVPKRQQQIAEAVKKQYLKKVQQFWVTHGREFREGEEYDRERAVKAIREKTKTTYARSKMIVETETTFYFNEVRRQTYDKSPDVTHYLFMAIRDHATTKWCKTRNGIVLEKGSDLLEQNTPPCFLGGSPVLTLEGWKRIDSIGTADYVWTHEQRWRRVTKIHRKAQKLGELFQIGGAMATANHPYALATGGFTPAKFFEPEAGVRSIPFNLQTLWKGAMGSVLQERPKILLKSLWKQAIGCYSERPWASSLQGEKEIEGGLCLSSEEKPSWRKLAGLCFRTPSCRGGKHRPLFEGLRNSASCKRDQKRQQDREFRDNDKLGSHKTASQGKEKKKFTVYNLEVDEDQTYYAGGFLVHNCHWNCRSEIIPLVPGLNPRHAQLVNDPTRKPSNRSLAPLPSGWGKR